jgi:DNA-binding MarR family transcriptional regulator
MTMWNPKGEGNSQAKLTAEQVVEIRRMWETGGYTQKYLTELFGIGKSQLSRIIKRELWKHV